MLNEQMDKQTLTDKQTYTTANDTTLADQVVINFEQCVWILSADLGRLYR